MPADLEAIRKAFCEHTYDFKTTASAKMLKRGLKVEDLDKAICNDAPKIVDDYPEDPRGPCCLVAGMIDLARPLHVVVGYVEEPQGDSEEPDRDAEDPYLDVITVYEPEGNRQYNLRERQ